MKYEALIFDFDGVLVDSVELKGRAFYSIYEPYGRETARRTYEYHMSHGGVSRREKFKHFHRQFLNRALSEIENDSLCCQFSGLVKQDIVDAPLAAGAMDFLEVHNKEFALFIVSGTPQDELREICAKKDLDRFFDEVLGSPQSKVGHITAILER